MIISASRRTDIPAFYNEWFFQRVKEGLVYVRNPFNTKQISEISLLPEDVDCFVFWTKDPANMISKLDLLSDFNYYFQFTLNAYRNDVELNTRSKKEIIATFKELSEKIGKDKVIWRYDPILLNDTYTKEYHYQWFEKFASELKDYTKRCVISFLDNYKKTDRNTKELKLQPLHEENMREIAGELSKIAAKYGLELETCSEGIDLSNVNIKKGKCIDDNVIEEITGKSVNVKKDKTQREVCGCVKSVDIGEYNTCNHRCLYCYANFDYRVVSEHISHYDVDSKLLCSSLKGDEKITKRKEKSIFACGKCRKFTDDCEQIQFETGKN